MAPSIGKRKRTTVVLVSLMVAVLVLALAVTFVPGYAAEEPRQKTFGSPKEAVEAMVAAVVAGDTSELLAIFGADAEDFMYSEDETEDEERREGFLDFYEERNRIEMLGANRAMLHVGKDDWTMPIPIVKTGNRWRFETKAGIQEILARRIGRNELAAIQVCLAYVDSQLEYAAKRAAEGLMEYAQKFASTAGKKDGLCWEDREGEPLSPMGPQMADACKEDFKGGQTAGEPVPYHGYFYRILKKQGKNAPGGAYDYLVNGKMIGGFALVAYPAGHGVTGVMTFIVNHDGIVYQKDLGRDTEKIAEAMTVFDPDGTWRKVE